MKWINLVESEQLNEIREHSNDKAIIIFKHSTRCSVSKAALDRLERNWKDTEMDAVEPYFLDLISYRQISNEVSQKFDVEHESPQVLVIKNGKAVSNYSHFEIDYNAIRKNL